jgi:hypothetical protein
LAPIVPDTRVPWNELFPVAAAKTLTRNVSASTQSPHGVAKGRQAAKTPFRWHLRAGSPSLAQMASRCSRSRRRAGRPFDAADIGIDYRTR